MRNGYDIGNIVTQLRIEEGKIQEQNRTRKGEKGTVGVYISGYILTLEIATYINTRF